MYYIPRGMLYHGGCKAEGSIAVSWLLIIADILRDYQQLTTHIPSALCSYKVAKLEGRIASFAPDWQLPRVHYVVITACETLIFMELWCFSEAWCSVLLKWKLIIWFERWIGKHGLFLGGKRVSKQEAEKILTNKPSESLILYRLRMHRRICVLSAVDLCTLYRFVSYCVIILAFIRRVGNYVYLMVSWEPLKILIGNLYRRI